MKAAGYESYAEAAGAFLQESDYIPTQMETQNSIMKKRTGEVRLPSDHKMKNKLVKINHDNNVMISQKTNEFQIIIKPQKKKQGGL